MLYKEKILFVDDEENILFALKRQLHSMFNIETADSGKMALAKISEEGPFAVIVVDMRMPEMDGLTLLKKVSKIAPETVKMMLTGNVDVQTAQNAINEGSIFRFMIKPWPTDLMIQCLNAAIRQYQLVRAEKELLENTLHSTVKVLVDILSIVNPVSFSKTQRLLTYSKHIIETMNLENAWQYEVAVLLSQIGTIVIPKEILAKQYQPAMLSNDEVDVILSHPAVSSSLIQKIPRMNQIAQMIELQNHSLHDLMEHEFNVSQTIMFGAQLIKISVDLDQMIINGYSKGDAIEDFRKKPNIYHPKFVDALDTFRFEKFQSKVEYITVDKLDTFMITAQSIEDKTGRVLLAKDQEITPASIEYLRSFSRRIGVKEPFQIRRVLPVS